MSNVIKGIENNVDKNRIRVEIAGQIMKLAGLKGKGALMNGVSLPAEHWYFENLVLPMVKGLGLDIHIDGVEYKLETANTASKRIPEGCHLAHTSFQKFFEEEAHRSKCGIAYMTGKPITADTRQTYDFIWSDYCYEANVADMKQFAGMLRDNMTNGLAYVTFCVKSRKRPYLKYAKMFETAGLKVDKTNDDSTEVQRMVLARLMQEIQSVNKDVRLVYNVLYHGGASGKIPMVTLGFSVGLGEEINPIVEVRRDGELKRRRNQLSKRLAGAQGWTLARFKKPVEQSSQKLASSPALYAAVTEYKDVWKSLKRDEKVKLAESVQSNIRQFGCMIAWNHGKLAAKKV